jgi:allantoicase
MDFTELIDLASEKLDGAVLYANDDFFAPKENLLKPNAPIFIEGKYTDLGKWMDGWETRRRRRPRLDEKFDWCVIRLGLSGIIHGVVVDTSFFRGNFPSHCSIEACTVGGQPDVQQLLGVETEWTEILPQLELEGDSQNAFAINYIQRVTHLRLKIYPDGGVARLRVFGVVVPDWEHLRRRNSELDLAAVEHGGTVLTASDMFFGHKHNLIMPGRAQDMSDGWETKRRRGEGYDWCIVKLGNAGNISRIEVDTAHFKGNYPESCSIEAGNNTNLDEIVWQELLPNVKLQAHTARFR